MNDESDEAFEAEGLDQWANTVGNDDELDALWASLLTATAEAGPQELEARLAQHFATLGARSRRTAEGLILSVMAATAAEGPAWEDWRVVLHRHFVRDERMDLSVAAAILAEWRREATPPDWHTLPDGVPERVFRSYIQDMRQLLDIVTQPDDTASAAAGLVTLTSELFDAALALDPTEAEALRHSADAATLLRDIERRLADAKESQPRDIAADLARAQALVEVTLRQLEIGPSVVH